MARRSAATDLGRRPRIHAAELVTDEGSKTDLETLVDTPASPSAPPVSVVWDVGEEDILPFEEEDEDDDTTLFGDIPMPGIVSESVTDAQLALGDRPGGHVLLSALGRTANTALYLGEKPMAYGPPRRAFVSRLARGDADYERHRRTVLADARIGAAFDHPNLVTVMHAGEDERGAYVVYEHLEGTNLARINAAMRGRGEALPFEIVAWIVAEVLRGLHHAHELAEDGVRPLNLVVGELCPDNVLVSRTGQVKLATFALRLCPRDDLGAVIEMAQRARAYLAPEALAERAWTPRSDVFAIGRLLFELLVGRSAFEGRRPDSVYIETLERGIPLHELGDEDVPVGLQKIVARATHQIPDQRYPDALSMATALNTWLFESGRHAMPSLVSRFLERHGLYEGAAIAFGPDLEALTEGTPCPERAQRPRVADLFANETLDEIGVSEGTLSAMIIREELDPDLLRVAPVDEIEPLAPPEDVAATKAPVVHEEISALHRIRRGPHPLTIGLLLGGALLFGTLVSIVSSLAS